MSFLIPARNEMFLKETVQNILQNIRGDSEINVVCDGSWPVPPGLDDHPRVNLLYYPKSIGQRAATNVAARVSEAKYICKIDAHCAIDEGFDLKMCEAGDELGEHVTQIPRMYNLHAFNWQCEACGNQTYQGPELTKCEGCSRPGPFKRVILWKPRHHKMTDFARFDSTLHFQYWGAYKDRPEAQGDIADVMSFVGACFFMRRSRYWYLDGLDEGHGSWGQMGTEISCKSWLSGGRQVVNKRTWFAHMFRTQGGFGFPYPLSGGDVERARRHSKKLWLEGKWPKAVHPLSWMIEKFAPVPDWPVAVDKTNRAASIKTKEPSKAFVYYSDCRGDEFLLETVRNNLSQRCLNGHELVSATLKPITFGKNVHVPLARGFLTMFKQILAGLEAAKADIVFLTEHDVLYHPSHFLFTPPRKDVYYYNENTWKVNAETGHALFYYCKQTSGLCAYRSLLLEHYRARVARVEKEGFTRKMGFEPGTHRPPRGIDNYKSERWLSEVPNIDIRHGHNLTQSRWRQDQFRNKRFCEGWTEAQSVPGWGQTYGRFKDFLNDIRP